MSIGLFWWLWAGMLAAAELATGTFYLLMVALGGVAGGLAEMAGWSRAQQYLSAALVTLIALAVLTAFKRARRRAAPPLDAAADRDVNLDVGQSLLVDLWQGAQARAQYRGAAWDVELAPGASAAPGRYRIVAVRGSRLVVEPADARAPSASGRTEA